MDLQAEKIQLAKMVLETENQKLLKAVKSVFKQWEAENKTDEAAQIINSIKAGIEEVKLHQQGKIKLKSARELLDEL